ncbi:MAG: ABC transporter ATP-binding protein, partial [Ornithinimicrobium sp.]
TLTSMEDVLDGWAGTLLVISHDRYLLERMTDRQMAMLGDGSLRDLPGGVEQYLLLRRSLTAGGSSTRGSSTGGASTTGKGSAGPSGSMTSSTSAAQAREARKAVERLERQLAALSRREGQVHDKMIAAATDASAMMQLSAELSSLHTEKEDLETEWLEAADLADG